MISSLGKPYSHTGISSNLPQCSENQVLLLALITSLLYTHHFKILGTAIVMLNTEHVHKLGNGIHQNMVYKDISVPVAGNNKFSEVLQLCHISWESLEHVVPEMHDTRKFVPSHLSFHQCLLVYDN